LINEGVEGMDKGKGGEGVELTKVKNTHRGDTWRKPFNIDFRLKNEKSDHTSGTVVGLLVGGGRGNEGDESEGM
jgi:hypothetical protein